MPELPLTRKTTARALTDALLSEQKKQADATLSEEKGRADHFLTILTDVRKSILDEANKRHTELPEFHQKIHRLYNKGTARDLVNVLIEELEIHLNWTRNLELGVDQLGGDINALASQLHGKDSEAIQKCQRRIAGLTEGRSNKFQEFQDKIERLDKNVSQLENEKRRVEKGLKLEHENEMQTLKNDHKRRIEDILRAQQLAESSLEAKHNSEKMSLQKTYDAEKKDLQNSLQAKHDTEKSRLRRGYDAEKNRLGSIIAGLERAFDAEKSGLQAKISEIENKHETEKNRLREYHESKSALLVERIEEMKQGHQSTIEQIEQGHKSERAQWRANKAKMVRDYKSEQDTMQKEHDSAIARMSQEHASAIAQMSQKHESAIAQLNQKHKSAIAQMRQEHESKRALLIARMSQMAEEHASQKAELKAQMSQMEEEHTSKQEKMREDFEARKLQLERQTAEEEARLKTEFKVKKAQLEMAHAEEKERLRKDIGEYSKALLARDDFKPMPDDEIKGRFLDLAQDVEDLARLEWKVNQKEWTRLLKKQILQDSIWVILHEYIFCSPFRIFGEEGQSLETQWNGKGLSPDTLYLSSQALTSADSQLDNGSYTWPKPEMEIERWRYVNIKECRAALTQPVPSEWDPRAKLKKGFKTSIDALRTEFMSTLGEVANLDKSNVQAMERMTIKAADMWLEFGMQRCRILVVLQGSNLKSAKERIQRAQEDTLKLVVVPELKRFGNSKGQDLGIEETVGGCNGETVDVSMRR